MRVAFEREREEPYDPNYSLSGDVPRVYIKLDNGTEWELVNVGDDELVISYRAPGSMRMTVRPALSNVIILTALP